jgi:hypothetical protein
MEEKKKKKKKNQKQNMGLGRDPVVDTRVSIQDSALQKNQKPKTN